MRSAMMLSMFTAMPRMMGMMMRADAHYGSGSRHCAGLSRRYETKRKEQNHCSK